MTLAALGSLISCQRKRRVANSKTDVGARLSNKPIGIRAACQLSPWDVPVIMIAAYGDAETKRRALENGPEALLTEANRFCNAP